MMAGPVCLRSPRLLPGVGVCFILMGTSERLPTRTTGDIWSRTIHELSMESVWRVDRVFPCRVYIDLNRRDSDMSTACLWQSSHR
jgi:hypothetical protein